MKRNINTSDPREKNREQSPQIQSDVTPRLEVRDDALANSSPQDANSDEKVIVNEQRENKIVNAPSQTAANTSEGYGNDDEIIN